MTRTEWEEAVAAAEALVAALRACEPSGVAKPALSEEAIILAHEWGQRIEACATVEAARAVFPQAREAVQGAELTPPERTECLDRLAKSGQRLKFRLSAAGGGE